MSIRSMILFAVAVALCWSTLAGFCGYQAGLRAGRAQAKATAEEAARVAAKAERAKHDAEVTEAMKWAASFEIQQRAQTVYDMTRETEANPQVTQGALLLAYGLASKWFNDTPGGELARKRAEQIAHETGVEIR